jgi:ABC-type branched-subunit amino acid transport system substrate-binding protein
MIAPVAIDCRSLGVAAAKSMYKKGAKNVGLVYEDTAYGYYLGSNFMDAFTKGELRCCMCR